MSNMTPEQRKAVAKALDLKIPFALYSHPGEKHFSFIATANPPTDRDLNHRPFFRFMEFADNNTHTNITYDLSEVQVLYNKTIPPQPRCLVQTSERSTDKLDYKAIVYAVIFDLQKRIRELGEQGKVVISRIIAAQTAGPESLLDVVEAYFDKFPDTFRYIAYEHTKGVWFGATPELVMDYSIWERILRTEALAGTLQHKSDKWDKKNRREHNMVKEHILDVLSYHKARVIGGKNNLKTVEKKFGRLRHLWTPIAASVAPEKIVDIFKDLVPTPAVGGYPREYAVQTILTHEPHLRRCYGGCVCVFHPDGTFKIYANLRCALAVYDAEKSIWNYNIYAGGGITADSDPIAEWFESEAKAAPLLRIIEKINAPQTGEGKKIDR